MAVRAKFKCVNITSSSPENEDNGKTIKLEAVINGSAENESFFRWTPSGSISLGCVNAEATKQFEIGKEYYIDFTPAE